MFVPSVRIGWRSSLSSSVQSKSRVHIGAKLHSPIISPSRSRVALISRLGRRHLTHVSVKRNDQRSFGTLFTAICVVSCVTGSAFWSLKSKRVTLNDTSTAYTKSLQPLSRDSRSLAWARRAYPGLDTDAATVKLRESESSTKLSPIRESDATSFDSIRLPSNNPVEDDFSFEQVGVGEADEWKVWGVYDGHAGWPTSKILREALTTYVVRELRHAQVAAVSSSPEAIDRAIKAGFLNFDDEIMSDALKALSDSRTHAEAISRIAPARAGSCALMAIFDPQGSTLRIACVGDSRAVLGRRSTDQTGKYTSEALSADQTGFNKDEIERIEKAHPNEANVIDKSTGRLLGLAVTRAFGDHRWKWPRDEIVKCQSEFYGTSPRPNYESPPYLTAEPEITTTKIANGDFLILASDGLWDHMTSEHAVECVSMWIEKYRAKSKSREDITPKASVPDSASDKPSTDTHKLTGYDWRFKGTPEHFTVEDDNVATHLVRNALGGNRTDLFCSVMSMQAPESRNVRDDITVQVVFFGNVLGPTPTDG